MKPKVSRAKKFEENTDFKASALWHRNYDVAMFTASEIGPADFESRQMSLENKFKGIPRNPRR